MSDEYRELLKEYAIDVMEGNGRKVEEVKFSLGTTWECTIKHDRGAACGMGKSWTRATMNALHLALNVSPGPSNGLYTIIFDAPTPRQ